MCSWQTLLVAMSDGAMPLFFGYKTILVHPFSSRMEGGGEKKESTQGG